MTTQLNIEGIRAQFPALSRQEGDYPAAYLDGPGGTQSPQSVIDAMSGTLTAGISNLGGGYGPSDDAVAITARARETVARFFNAEPSEIVFGQNMTSLTFAVSRAIARTWNSGDNIVLTSLDHDANFTPWATAAAEAGVEVRIAQFDPDTFLLEPDALIDLIDDSTRLVAVCLSSNALGTVVDVAPISEAASRSGAVVYVDAVHAGPHHKIDVQQLGCDFLAASAYKFFGPHTGMLYGRLELLAALDAYKVRPAPSDPPGKWETGTQSFESLAGVIAAIEHIEKLGWEAITGYEKMLGDRFLAGLEELEHVRLWGVPDMNEHRVTTFAVSVDGHHPDDVARALRDKGLFVWSGHYYAVNVMNRLGLLDKGGLVRIGFVHYNTTDEVDRVLAALSEIE